jgi:hypothetical protein
MLYNQFRYLNEMRDLCASVDPTFDSSFESTFWKANLYLTAAKHKLQDPATPGHAKRTIQNVWENNEFWRATLPTWFPSADTLRFMRLLQALEIPRAGKITAWV